MPGGESVIRDFISTIFIQLGALCINIGLTRLGRWLFEGGVRIGCGLAGAHMRFVWDPDGPCGCAGHEGMTGHECLTGTPRAKEPPQE